MAERAEDKYWRCPVCGLAMRKPGTDQSTVSKGTTPTGRESWVRRNYF
jgi:hypothetical protein